MAPSLSIVIPAYDEELRLPRTLDLIGRYLERRPDLETEVVVVDDGSTDRTADRARAAGARVVRYAPNRGKGHAARRGLLESRGARALVSDADLSTPIEDLEKLERAMDEGSLAMALGSRGLPASKIPVPQGRLRQTMGKTFNRIIRAATGLPFRDTQCGFKLLDMRVMRPVVEHLRIDGFAWDVELCLLAHRVGLPVAEVPVVWRNSPESKVSLVVDPLKMLLEVWRIRRASWFRDRSLPFPFHPGKAREPRPLTREEAVRVREEARRGGRTVVFTNGCFDLLHAGHVQYLAAARALGDFLVVGLNDDASVSRLKGKERPLVPLEERAELLLGLESVDAVVPFGEDTPAALIDALVPDVLVKGADWAPDAVVGRETVERAGGRLVLVPLVPGMSTSTIVERIIGRP